MMHAQRMHREQKQIHKTILGIQQNTEQHSYSHIPCKQGTYRVYRQFQSPIKPIGRVLR